MALASKKLGIPGSAVLFGTAGLYLVYVGVQNLSFFDSLRALLRGERPVSNEISKGIGKADWTGTATATGNDTGITQLQGYAASAYPKIKSLVPNLTIGGWRSSGSVPNSDHPKGKALDIMNPTAEQAAKIIFVFKTLPGAKQWIWYRETAFRTQRWQKKTYLGPNPHTDHVHLSFE